MTDDELNKFLNNLEQHLGDTWSGIEDLIDKARPKPKTNAHLTTLFSVASDEAKKHAASELKRLLREGEALPEVSDGQFRMVLQRLCELSGAESS